MGRSRTWKEPSVAAAMPSGGPPNFSANLDVENVCLRWCQALLGVAMVREWLALSGRRVPSAIRAPLSFA